MPGRSPVPLATLLDVLPGRTVQGAAVPICGLAYDSRQVSPGFLFAAIRGFTQDGHTYVADAVRRGAAAVLVDHPVDEASAVTQIIVPDTRAAVAHVAAAFYAHPSRALVVIGVTGTNGKGVTTYFADAVLSHAGHRSAVIGTMGARGPSGVIETARTTPEAPDLQRLLADLRDDGVTHVAMEVASHALALHRVDGTRFQVGVFTNLTPDHLDFHGTLEAYLGAKRRLFEMVEPDGRSVLNAADPAAAEMARASRAPVLRFALNRPADGSGPVDLWAEAIELRLDGTTFRAATAGGTWPVRLHIGGAFNVANALAALATGMALGIHIEQGAAALETVQGVPGRFEPIREGEGQDFAVVVDYAHTPDGLENVLRTARQITKARVVAVFGCGGDRDRSKRPVMGRLAVTLADLAIVTSDNPRTEDPRAIIEEILQGIRATAKVRRRRFEVEPDRRAAIQRAIAAAAPGDIVVIAGKGHEPYQEIQGVRHPFDDRDIARAALRSRLRSNAR